MIMLDLQKAFDTVDYQSYLSDKTQTVQVNDAYSNIENITCGVPQNSILGSLFYLCYVSDICL